MLEQPAETRFAPDLVDANDRQRFTVVVRGIKANESGVENRERSHFSLPLLTPSETVHADPLDRKRLELAKSLLDNGLRILRKESLVTKRVSFGEPVWQRR